eukprot:588505-Pleurochrysis_carterae.AAC.1
MQSAPLGPPRLRLRSGVGVTMARAAASLMGTTWMSAHSCQSLTAAGCIHCTEAHVRSLVGSNGRSVVWPTSPARSNKLCEICAAAHSMRAFGVPSHTTRKLG